MKKKSFVQVEEVAFFRWSVEAGNKLREKRIEKNLLMKELADSTMLWGDGCSKHYIGTLEHGRVSSLSGEKLATLIASLDIGYDYFYPVMMSE